MDLYMLNMGRQTLSILFGQPQRERQNEQTYERTSVAIANTNEWTFIFGKFLICVWTIPPSVSQLQAIAQNGPFNRKANTKIAKLNIIKKCSNPIT